MLCFLSVYSLCYLITLRAPPIEKTAHREMCAVIGFLSAKGLKAPEIYGENIISVEPALDRMEAVIHGMEKFIIISFIICCLFKMAL